MDDCQRPDRYTPVEARYITGDTRTVMRSLPDASVDLVLCSPPFLGLRSYLPNDDPAKADEMGSEGTPGEFLDALLDVVEECRRVLAPHGSIVFELGDTYAGSGGAGGDYGTKDPGAKPLREGQPKFGGSALAERRTRNANRPSGERISRRRDQAAGILPAGHDAGGGDGWPLDKSLCLVPELFRFALVYGFNPLTGRQTARWRARNVVRWCRPNPPVGALADKVRPATSDMLIACTGRKRYFDLDAVREPFVGHARVGTGVRKGQDGAKPEDNRPNDLPTRMNTHDGAPPLDHWWYDEDDTFDQDAWLVSTEAYPGSHYATWPQKLLERPIKAMCPLRVCTVCGVPSERIAHSTNATGEAFRRNRQGHGSSTTQHPDRAERETTGWTDCGHDAWRPGVVLDPFAGSGTTLAVAFGHGRSSIGIDLDRRNADLARQRVGMWLITENHEPAEVVA